MSETVLPNVPYEGKFESIDDFKWSMMCGGEINFVWKGVTYYAFGRETKTPDAKEQMLVGVVGDPDQDLWADTADEILEYNVGGDRLRDVITQVVVTDRTI